MPAAASNEKSEFACAHTRSRHCTLSLRRRRSTCAREVHASRHAGWSRPIPYESTLRQQNGPLARCTAVLRHASRGLQRAAYLRMCVRKIAPLHARSLSGGSAARALAACARRAALAGVGPCPMKAHCSSVTAISLSERPCSDVPAAASNDQLTCACAQGKSRHCTRALSREEVQHARLWRARAAPLWLELAHALCKPIASA